MRIELPTEGLTKTKRAKVDGLSTFDEDSGLAVFEWPADAGAPHDYATAFDRARRDVEAAGGTVTGEPRIVG